MQFVDPQLPLERFPNAYDIATVEAIIAFYDKKYTLESLLTYLHTHKFGSTVTEVADCLVQHGVSTTIVAGNPSFFVPTAWQQILVKPDQTPQLSSMPEFERVMKKGVKLVRQIPSPELIMTELRANRPVIVILQSSTFVPQLESILHYVILSGVENDQIICLDVLPHRRSFMADPALLFQDIRNINPSNPNTGCVILTGTTTHTSSPE